MALKVCEKCGLPQEKGDKCARCGGGLLPLPDVYSEPQPDDAQKRRRDWIALGIGIPLFLLLMYGCYTLYGTLLQPR